MKITPHSASEAPITVNLSKTEMALLLILFRGMSPPNAANTVKELVTIMEAQKNDQTR